MKSILLVFMVLFISSTGFAEESGFVYRGKEHLVYKDGQKVGQGYAELYSKDRAIASENIEKSNFNAVPLYFQKHGDITCYSMTVNSGQISCVKK